MVLLGPTWRLLVVGYVHLASRLAQRLQRGCERSHFSFCSRQLTQDIRALESERLLPFMICFVIEGFESRDSQPDKHTVSAKQLLVNSLD